LNLSAFNSIFGFLPNLDLDRHHGPREFNPNTFWYTITGNYQYDDSYSKGTITRNSCIQVGQCVLACGLFAREDGLTIPHLSELYFLYSILQGTLMDHGSFFSNQLLIAATSSTKRMVSRGLMTPIGRSVGTQHNPDDRVSRPESLALATFKQMKFCTMEGGRMCWIYPGNRFIPLPNVDRITLLNPNNLSFVPVMTNWFIPYPCLFHDPI